MMKIAIITSKIDPASMSIREDLIKKLEWEQIGIFDTNPIYKIKENNIYLYLLENESIYCNNANEIDTDLFIFATKHASSKGNKSLCVHTPGNWTKADMGGENKKLSITPSLYIKKAFDFLINKNVKDYEITVEQTHHGPFIDKEVMFIEIGSDINSWKDKYASDIISDAIISLINYNNKIKNEEQKVALIFGGGHYNQAANKILQRTDYLIGHICSKYYLDLITKEIVLNAIDKTNPKTTDIILDWKGLGKGKENLMSILEEIKILKPYIKINRIKDILKEE
jgi:D-aminoacyl-tRNA deacylase